MNGLISSCRLFAVQRRLRFRLRRLGANPAETSLTMLRASTYLARGFSIEGAVRQAGADLFATMNAGVMR